MSDVTTEDLLASRDREAALRRQAKAERDAARAEVERLREELATIRRIAGGNDRESDDALDLVLVATRRALGP